MNKARRTLGLSWIALALNSTACAHITLEELCQREGQECGEDPDREQACLESGRIFRDEAEEKGCAGAFDAYIDCVANSEICDQAAVVKECGHLEDGVPCLKDAEDTPAPNWP
ncbi:MAG: hypothetical protein HOW73_40535 [Polyangiaceae bacterium]|nr:hypothetical protein [Polyangiaceae bacterium]